MALRPDVRARHRAQSDSTRRAILETTLALLEEHPWPEIPLERIMAETGLTRTAFYRHFAGRDALLLALLVDVGGQLEEVPAAWEHGGGDPLVELRDAIDTLVAAYIRHGRLLDALAAAANEDGRLGGAYRALADRLVAAVAERIERDVAAGRSEVRDPVEVARALVWMNERYLRDRFGHDPTDDPVRVAAALTEIWIATVYRDDPPARP